MRRAGRTVTGGGARRAFICLLVFVTSGSACKRAPRMAVPACSFLLADEGEPEGRGVAVQVAAGGAHACLRHGHSLYCWGRNIYGELGSAGGQRLRPTLVEGLPGVLAVTAGGGGGVSPTGHTCAVGVDARAYCWGQNDVGQLGDGTRKARPTPRPVSNLDRVQALGAGSQHTCALRSDGSVWCWGRGDSGQLGTGGPQDHLEPTRVLGLAGVKALSVGHFHACVRDSSDQLRCWGANSRGEVGTGDRTAALVPVLVAGSSGVVEVATGFSTTCVVGAAGGQCWGSNDFGQMGSEGESREAVLRARPVPGLVRVRLFTLGGAHACALGDGGATVCWGSNAVGQVGGSGASVKRPQPVRGLPAIAELEAGASATFATTTTGEVWAWGDNGEGQLGDGTTLRRISPVCIVGRARPSDP